MPTPCADQSVTGASVYMLSTRGASNEAARWLAERENAADLKGGVRLDDKSSTLASGAAHAVAVRQISGQLTAAERVSGRSITSARCARPQVQHAAFVVLKSPDIPSMLVETAYISNPAEERQLRTPSASSRLADAISTRRPRLLCAESPRRHALQAGAPQDRSTPAPPIRPSGAPARRIVRRAGRAAV